MHDHRTPQSILIPIPASILLLFLALCPPPILGQVETPATAATGEDDSQDSLSYPAIHEAHVSTEIIWAPDIELTDTALGYSQTYISWEWALELTYKSYREEYEPNPPFDALGSPDILTEDNYGARLSLSRNLHERFAWLVSGGLYDGYEGYRSVWLANYYDQQFNFVPGYEDPDPKGINGGSGFRWEYIPGTAYLEARVSHFEDDVAPGYEIDLSTGMFRLLQGHPKLKTWSYYVSSENILSPRVRTLVALQATDTTARRWRYSTQGSVNVALSENWFWRSQGGYTEEDPEFEAWFAASTLEWEVHPSVLLSVGGRYYHDTGEIENSLLLSNAAPGLDAWHVGFGFRYIWPNASLKIFAGPYFTDYESADVGTEPWANLYKDRDWGLAQMALSVQY